MPTYSIDTTVSGKESDANSTTSTSNECITDKIERVVSSVPMPFSRRLQVSDVYTDNKDGVELPNYTKLGKYLFKEAFLDPELVIRIISEVMEVFKTEPNLLSIDAPLTICGDIHGQFYDLLRLFEIGGAVESTTYLFLGDYVDRGSFSCECLIYLYSLKINFPKSVFLLRGNHECRHLTDYFTFKNECTYKYNSQVYEKFCDSFNTLPLAAHVNKQFLCVHGGISPELNKLSDIDKINRFTEPPSSGLFCDLLWSDPIDVYGTENHKDGLFTNNSVRGCSYNYSYKAVCEFLERNKLLSVVRAHEAQDTGYRMYKKTKSNGFPSLITIFSAPNYLDVYNNGGAVLKYEGNVLNIKQFKCSPHPYYLPNFMNVFTWSVPFVGEKVMEILECILSTFTDDNEDEDAYTQFGSQAQLDRKAQIKNKIRAVGKMSKLFGNLREENESVMALKGLSANGVKQTGILTSGKDTVENVVRRLSSSTDETLSLFEEIKQIDLINEKLPPIKEKDV